jgi:3-oxoacyl-[acyl-carrier-protein] synthase III
MAYLQFKNVKIAGISACVPKHIKFNNEYEWLFSKEDLEKTIRTIGVVERRIASESQCTSDFCFNAAESLLSSLEVNRNDIDVLILVTQTPDYRLPATSVILQNKLGLKKSCVCFDINLGCSGYIYGLANAFLHFSQPSINKILLLVGDTITKIVNDRDKVSTLLFGDAGTATLIERTTKQNDSYFSLNSDGSGEDALAVKGGGYRNLSSIQTLEVKSDENGNLRNAEQLIMNGPDVFNFTINEVPKDILSLIKFAQLSTQDIDYLFYHQANKFMLDYLTKKLKYPTEKVPYSVERFGNTSSASIPLTIVNNKNSMKYTNDNIILAGFGVGLSWGSALIHLSDTFIDNLIEF